MAQLTPDDVKAHASKETGLYLIIDKAVYSLADFMDEHPGGSRILQRFAGKDATKQFWKVIISLLSVYIRIYRDIFGYVSTIYNTPVLIFQLSNDSTTATACSRNTAPNSRSAIW